MKPHLIVIMADQLRYDLLGTEATPHINALIAESTVFPNAYCASPLCVPARGAFFTGRYPNVNGSLINPWEPQDASHGNVHAGTPNLYTLLDGTWDSWHTGKQHLYTADAFDRSADSRTHWLSLNDGYGEHLKQAGMRKPGGPGFRGMMPEMVAGRTTRMKTYSIPTTACYEPGLDFFFDGYIKDTSLRAIRERDQSKPFLLNAMFIAPHPPYDIPEPFYSRFRDWPMPENVGLWSADQSPLQLYNLTGHLGGRYSRADWQKPWDVYVGLTNLLDQCVGEIISELKSEEMYDDALILFTSDHGEMLGSHCLYQKMCMYEESVRAPLAFKLPHGAAGVAESDALVSHVDVLPTLCDLLDVDPPGQLSGQSLASCITTGESLERDCVYTQFDGNGARGNFQRAVIRGTKKLIVDLFKDETYFELYDIADDPQEKFNRAFEDQAAVRELTDVLIAWMSDTNDLVKFPASAYERFLTDYAPYRRREPHYPLGGTTSSDTARI